MKFLLLNAFMAAAVATVDVVRCEESDGVYFLANSQECMEAIRERGAATAVEVTVVEATPEESGSDIPAGFEVAIDDSEDKEEFTARAADLSGCGVHRTCTACRDLNANKCYWNPGTGCVKRFNNAPNVCTAANQVAPQCNAFKDCNSCTIQNGCVFYRGMCTYSRGTGCLNDPTNCINYSWNCPAKPPVEVLVPYYQPQSSYQPPAAVQVQTPDRVEQTVDRVEDMILGMSANELRRLRNELDAVLIAAENAARNTASYNAPLFQPQVYSMTPGGSYSSATTAATIADNPYVATVFAPTTVYGQQGSSSAFPGQPSAFPAPSSAFPAQFSSQSQNQKPQTYYPAYVTPTYTSDPTTPFFINSQAQPAQVQPPNPWGSSKPAFSFSG